MQCSFLQRKFCWKCICQYVCKIEEKPPNSEFPNISHTTWNSYHIHFWYSGSSFVITQREEGNDLCIENTDYDILCSDCTGWGSGSNWHSCIGLKMISPSWQAHTGTSWMLLSQPKLQTDWNNQMKQVYWSFIMQLLLAWTKIKEETPFHPNPFLLSIQFHPKAIVRRLHN